MSEHDAHSPSELPSPQAPASLGEDSPDPGPGLADPDLADPDLTDPDLTDPDLTEPDLAEPDLAEERAHERRQAREEQVAGLLGDLSSEEAAELRELLGTLRAERVERLPSEERPPDLAAARPERLSPQTKDRVARGLLFASVIAFVCAISYGWAVGRALPNSLRAQKTWLELGILPGGTLPPPGQTVDSVLKDPWEHPYRLTYRGSAQWRIYSQGPNGHDEAGQGDDIPLPGGWRWLVGVFAIYGEGFLGILGLILVWLGAGFRVLWLPRSRAPRVESARAIGLLLVPALLSWLASRLFGEELVALLPQRFVLPSDIVLWGTIAAVLTLCFFMIKGWRKANLPQA